MDVKLEFVKNFNIGFDGFKDFEDFIQGQDNPTISEVFNGQLFPEYDEVMDVFPNPNAKLIYIVSEFCSDEYFNFENEIISYGTVIRESEDGNVTIYHHPILGNCILVDFDNPGIILVI